MNGHERVYAKINLNHFMHNVMQISAHLKPPSQILAVLKADAYGHGSSRIAKELEAVPSVYGYAVATIEEALEIRQAGAKKPLLMLSYCFPSGFRKALEQDVQLTVFDTESAYALHKVASEMGKKAIVHIAVDTGMTRIGITPDEAGLAIVKEIAALESIGIQGIYTHFAQADETDKTSALKQLERFQDFQKLLKVHGITIPFAHCCNSAGIIDLSEASMDLVRAGIILYGLWPSEEANHKYLNLKPVMELKSSICFVKDVPKGVAISYGGTYVTSAPTKVATVTIGYADGYPRCLSNKGYVLIHGKKAVVLGRVCMDQLMVDVTEIPEAKRGDEVTLVGVDGEEEISMELFSKLSDRINYEAVCDVGKRVPRIYEKDGKLSLS